MHNGFVAAISDRRKFSSVVANSQRGTNIHGTLRGGRFLGRFGLFKKMDGSLIVVVRQKIRRFFETETTQRTAGIHIPLPRRVLRLLAQFVRHGSNKLRIALKKINVALKHPWMVLSCGGFFLTLLTQVQLRNPPVV
jgi:hypothetical protein